MIELSDAISTATGYISDATKASQSVAALITSVTATKTALDEFKNVFFKSRNTQLSELGVCDLINHINQSQSVTDAKSINGILAPIMDFKGEEEENYKNVSTLIQDDISDLLLPTPENEFLTINSKEWLVYGCSLQSTTQDRVQLLSLVETEEANSIPVLVTKRFYKRKLDDPALQFGIQSTLTGLVVPIDNKNIQVLLGRDKTNRLKLSGNNQVLIPDETLINDFDVDFSFKPDVHFNKDKCFFLGFLWAVYMNVHTNQIIPIYEYGNIGDKNSFTLLSEKLIHQIEFFKKRIWYEFDRPPHERRYKLLICYNDALADRIKSVFQEDDFFENREDLLFEAREEIIEKLF